MIGSDFSVLRNQNASSPKLRIPTHRYVFEEFNEKNNIETTNFESVGSLAPGGLSNAWGCGVSVEYKEEIRKFPCEADDMMASYRDVSKRIGISGRNNDDMSNYFGVDSWSQAPIEIDDVHEYLQNNYNAKRQRALRNGFRLGRARLAVLSENHFGRKACSLSGNCLWGCQNRALYSAADELPHLMARPNFKLINGFIVDRITTSNNNCCISGKNLSTNEEETITCRKLILAAGTIATTKLVLMALKTEKPARLLFCPTAAFLIWLPFLLGRKQSASFGFAQLAYSLKIDDGANVLGWLFSTAGIPVSEFAGYLPFKRPNGIEFLRALLSSCIVGNLFLPGSMSSAEAWIKNGYKLHIEGGY
jgi:hypothetical protein